MNMNKIFAAAGCAAMLFAGCSSADKAADNGATTSTAHVDSDFGEITATVTKEDGKITAISIDQDSDGKSKKELGDDYGMAAASSIGKDWAAQVEFLEKYLVENGIDSVKLDADGYAEEEDVKSGCTINLKDIMEAVDEAAAK